MRYLVYIVLLNNLVLVASAARRVRGTVAGMIYDAIVALGGLHCEEGKFE